MERKAELTYKHVTVAVAASPMNTDQELLKGLCRVRVFSCSSPCCFWVVLLGFYALFFLLQKLEEGAPRPAIWQYCSEAGGLF